MISMISFSNIARGPMNSLSLQTRSRNNLLPLRNPKLLIFQNGPLCGHVFVTPETWSCATLLRHAPHQLTHARKWNSVPPTGQSPQSRASVLSWTIRQSSRRTVNGARCPLTGQSTNHMRNLLICNAISWDVICGLCLCPDCESARCNTLSLVDCDWIQHQKQHPCCESIDSLSWHFRWR